MPANRHTNPAHATRRASAFTLLELLVVMGILLLLAVLTTVSVGSITSSAKVAGATNTIVATLGNARGIAIRDNAYVMVAFRMKRDTRVVNGAREPQIVQAVTAKWTGEVVRPSGTNDTLAERFIAVPGVAAVDLPVGVRVAGPSFAFSTQDSVGENDRYWRTQPRFVGSQVTSGTTTTFSPDLARTEVGSMIGVLFGPDGRVLSRNPLQVLEIVVNENEDQDAWVAAFLDSDGSGQPRKGGTAGGQSFPYFQYDEPADQPLIDYVPYLAVFNDKELRDKYNTAPWAGPANNLARRNDISEFVDGFADRITFNRYTGVPGVVNK